MAPDGAIVTLNGRVVLRETVNDSPPILQIHFCRDTACRVRKITATVGNGLDRSGSERFLHIKANIQQQKTVVYIYRHKPGNTELFRY